MDLKVLRCHGVSLAVICSVKPGTVAVTFEWSTWHTARHSLSSHSDLSNTGWGKWKQKLQIYIRLTKKSLSSDSLFSKQSTLMNESTVNNYVFIITNVYIVCKLYLYIYAVDQPISIICLSTCISREWHLYRFFLILKTNSWGRPYYRHSPFHKSDRKR